MLTAEQANQERARAERVVAAVLRAVEARGATAVSARAVGLGRRPGRWVLALGKGAIGMARGLSDVCGEPDRQLVVTVDGPEDRGVGAVVRSDHPLPTERSVRAGLEVCRFVEDARSAGASELLVLLSGGASSLICRPIPGVDLEDYRALVADMLGAGWPIDQMNTVRRAIDELKGGGLGRVAGPMPVRLAVLSDVRGNALHDVGSGPFVASPTTPDHAAELIERSLGDRHGAVLTALSCRPLPSGVEPLAGAFVVANNQSAVRAAVSALEVEGVRCVSDRSGVSVGGVGRSAALALGQMAAGEGLAWGGEWDVPGGPGACGGFGGRCQHAALELRESSAAPMAGVVFATDGVDGHVPGDVPPAAGACVWSGMWWPDESGQDREWLRANSHVRLATRDGVRPAGEPAAHLHTGPTGTNVNDLLIAWRPV